jgi:hypothetical protein
MSPTGVGCSIATIAPGIQLPACFGRTTRVRGTTSPRAFMPHCVNSFNAVPELPAPKRSCHSRRRLEGTSAAAWYRRYSLSPHGPKPRWMLPRSKDQSRHGAWAYERSACFAIWSRASSALWTPASAHNDLVYFTEVIDVDALTRRCAGSLAAPIKNPGVFGPSNRTERQRCPSALASNGLVRRDQ